MAWLQCPFRVQYSLANGVNLPYLCLVGNQSRQQCCFPQPPAQQQLRLSDSLHHRFTASSIIPVPHPEPLSFFQGSALPQVPFLHPREPKSTQSLSVFQGSRRVIQSPSAIQSPFFCPRERSSHCPLFTLLCLPPFHLPHSSSKGAYHQINFVCLVPSALSSRLTARECDTILLCLASLLGPY